MQPVAPASATPQWWQGAVVGFAETGRRWLKARYPSLRHQHDDLMGEAALQLTRLLSDPGEHWPASWFGQREPATEDLKRFEGLAFTVLARRVQDEFRRDVGHWLESLEQVPEEQHPVSTAPDAATALGHTRAVRALIFAMQAMSLRDQTLVERVALGDTSQPMTGAERERVSQLRRRLRLQLLQVLGEDGPPAAPKVTDGSSHKKTGDGIEP